MRKRYIIALIAVFLTVPLVTYSAPNLAARLSGKLLLAVEDKGKIFYVGQDGYRYEVTRSTAQKILMKMLNKKKMAMGISNKNLEQIPLREIEIEPEPEPQVVERIVYVDRYIEKQCASVESYKNEISDLNRQIETLKANWDIKGQQPIIESTPEPTPEPNAYLKSQLNKSYALIINDKKKQVLDLQDQYARAEQIVKAADPSWNSLNLPDRLNNFQRQKRVEIDSLHREISMRQNELEKKLLELE